MKDGAGPPCSAAPARQEGLPAQFRLVCGLMPDGGTGILTRHVEWPWSFPRGFRRDGLHGPLTLLPQTAGAALLPGDAWGHALHLNPGAQVLLRSAGAMLVHAAPLESTPPGSARPPGRVDWRIVVEAGAELQFLPDPYVLSPGARIDQRLDLMLHPGAAAVVFDGFCRRDPKAAAGGRWSSQLTLRDAAGRALIEDRQMVEEAQLLALQQLPGGYSAFGSALLAGPPDRQARWRALWPEGALDLPGCRGASGGLRGGAGLILRLAAESGGALDRAFAAIAQRLRGG